MVGREASGLYEDELLSPGFSEATAHNPGAAQPAPVDVESDPTASTSASQPRLVTARVTVVARGETSSLFMHLTQPPATLYVESTIQKRTPYIHVNLTCMPHLQSVTKSRDCRNTCIHLMII